MYIHNNNEGGIVTIQESWVCTSIIAVILGLTWPLTVKPVKWKKMSCFKLQGSVSPSNDMATSFGSVVEQEC